MSRPSTTTAKSIVAPYTTAWSAEIAPRATVIQVPGGGIGYADEKPKDRDQYGILWTRASRRPGEGHPLYKQVHPLRQRRAMRNLLCVVCGERADRTDDGVLWLVRDLREDSPDLPDWPNGMAVAEPPICLPCVPFSARACPSLRQGAVAIRAGQYPIAGVRGTLYIGGRCRASDDHINVALDDPLVHWVKAHHLIRELHECTVIEVGDVPAGRAQHGSRRSKKRKRTNGPVRGE